MSSIDQPSGNAQTSETITPATLHIDHFVKEDRHNVMDGPFYTKGGGM